MRVDILLHKIFAKTIHRSRIHLLSSLVTGVIKGKELKLSTLGRSLGHSLSERSGIRKVDKFLNNTYFQTQASTLYSEIIRFLIKPHTRPFVCVDWTKLPNVEQYALRVALMSEGRALTLYEEQHPKKLEGNDNVHRQFLSTFGRLLPEGCRPIMVTDAGFKNPWFKAVKAKGWDFIGRVRGKTHYQDEGPFQPCQHLHTQATTQPRYLGEKVLAKKNPFTVGFYLVRGRL